MVIARKKKSLLPEAAVVGINRNAIPLQVYYRKKIVTINQG
jgi:hypothetical protein